MDIYEMQGWVYELNKHPEYIDELNLSQYSRIKFIEFLSEEISKMESEVNNVLLCNKSLTPLPALANFRVLMVNNALLCNKSLTYGLDGGNGFIHKNLEAYKTARQIVLSHHTVKKPEKSRNPVSYTWNTNPDEELPELWEKMKDAGLIAPVPGLQNFIKVFTGQPLSEIEPVEWRSKPVLLAYFIDKLRAYIVTDDKFNLWETAEKCFSVNKKSKLRNIADSYMDNKTRKPKNHIIIDELF